MPGAFDQYNYILQCYRVTIIDLHVVFDFALDNYIAMIFAYIEYVESLQPTLLFSDHDGCLGSIPTG